MKFASPIYFLLLLPAIILFLLFIFGKIGKEAVLKFSSVQLVRQAGAKKTSLTRMIPGLLRLIAMVLIILALARPQTGTGEEKSTEQVVDIMVALDISGSMAALDFYPDDRLVGAKREAKKFVEGRPHDRIGVVVFASQSITQCPLTTDHKAVLTLVDQIHLGMVEDGTAIGSGLATAINRLRSSEAKSKVVILLTDGVNNSGEIDPLTAAELAKQFGVKVYTIGVGKSGESLLPINDPRFGQRMIKIQNEIDEKTLTQIAHKTGGEYFRAQDIEALRDIFRQIDSLEKTEVTVQKFTHYDEHYFWFLWPAFLVILLEVVWTSLVKVKIP